MTEFYQNLDVARVRIIRNFKLLQEEKESDSYTISAYCNGWVGWNKNAGQWFTIPRFCKRKTPLRAMTIQKYSKILMVID